MAEYEQTRVQGQPIRRDVPHIPSVPAQPVHRDAPPPTQRPTIKEPMKS